MMHSEILFAQSGSGETVVKDTFAVNLGTLPPICIDESVVLSCPEDIKDILTYTWINKTTGDTIGTERTVRVKPTQTTEYELQVLFIDKNDERIKNWDFEKGAPKKGSNISRFLEFTSKYTYESRETSTALWSEGIYKIGENPHDYHPDFLSIGDHTSGEGYMMIINGHTSVGTVVWEQSISNLTVGKQYAFSMWAVPVTPSSPPELRFSINGDGKVFETFSPLYNKKWQVFFRLWTATATSAKISLVNDVINGSGNDFALDDFSFAPVMQGIGNITVKVVPKIEVAKLANSEVCVGANVDIKAELSAGSEINAYKWYKGGTLISDVNSLRITNAEAGKDAGTYSCKVSGICGADSVTFKLSVLDSLKVAPMTDQTICENDAVEWTAKVLAGAVRQYEWRGGNASWAGANSATYRKRKASVLDKGTYVCNVFGKCGDKTISANLDVDRELVVTFADDTTICEGGSARLWAIPNLSNAKVTWKYPDGRVVVGNSFLTSTPATYKCSVESSSQCALPQEKYMTLKTFGKGTLTVTPKQRKCLGDGVTFETKVNGGVGLHYRWSGPNGFVSTNAVIQLPSITNQQEGKYTVTVTDTCGLVLSKETEIEIIRPNIKLTITPAITACPGESVVFEVLGGEAEISEYVWTCPDKSVVRGKRVQLNDIQLRHAGKYECKVKGTCGFEQTLNTSLALWDVLSANGNTGVAKRCVGESVSFVVNATGKDVAYRWTKDGAVLPLSGNSCDITDIKKANAGRYTCLVTAACGTPVSLDFNLQLKPETKIVSRTADGNLAEHERLYLFVNAEGDNNQYQWVDNGVVGQFTSSNSFEKDDIGVAGDKVFICRVKGDCGVDEATIRMSVGAYNVITKDTTIDVCETAGVAYKLSARPAACPETENLSYCWIKGVDTVSKTAVLQLSNMSAQMAGSYRGVAKGNSGVVNVLLTVNMIKKPELHGFENNGSAMVDTLRLCEGESAKILPIFTEQVTSISWYRNGTWKGNSEALVIDNAAIALHEGNYKCETIGRCGYAEKEFSVVVRKKLVVSPNQVDFEACLANPVAFRVIADGHQVKYSWTGPGRSWTGTTSDVYAKGAVEREDAGKYACAISSTCGTDVVEFNLAVRDTLDVATISDATVCLNSPFQWVADVRSGYLPAYTWSGANDGKWAGKNLPIYSRTAVTQSDEGRYICRVHTMCGEKTIAANLHVREALKIVKIASDTVVCKGEKVGLWVVANLPSAVVKWTCPDGTVVTNDTLWIDAVDDVTRGTYTCTVTDVRCGVTVSEARNVKMHPVPGKLSVSSMQRLCPGVHASFTASMSGSGVHYAWSGPNGFRATGATINISSLTDSDEGEYQVTATATCGTPQTAKTGIEIYRPAKALRITPATTICTGESITLQVTGGSAEVTGYQWTRNGANLGVGSKIVLDKAKLEDIGNYTCHVTGTCAVDTMLKTVLDLWPMLSATGNTGVHEKCIGDVISFTAMATGRNVVYRWEKDGVVLPCVVNTYVINKIALKDAGHYRCAMTADCGEPVVLDFELKLKEGTKILDKTPDLDVAEHEQVFLYVNATGANNKYSWTVDGKSLQSTSNRLYLLDIGVAGEKIYKCRVNGDCGVDETSIRVRVGQYVVVSSDSTVEVCEARDMEYKLSIRPTGCSETDKLSYCWLKGNDTVSNTAVLKLLKISEAASYRGVVWGACGRTEVNLQVNVVKNPEIVRFENNGVSVGDTLILCSGESANVSSVFTNGISMEWMKNDVPLQSFGVLSITDANVMQHQGKYKCVVYGKCVSTTKEFVVVIHRKLKVIDAPSDIQACSDASAEFRITTVGYNERYSWSGPGTGWTGNRSNVYYKSKVSRLDAGTYRCIVNSECGDDTVYSVLNIEKELAIADVSRNQQVCLNTPVDLFVVAESGNVAYMWTLPDGSVRNVQRFTVHVTPQDTGIYRYTVKGKCGVLTGDVHIRLYPEMSELTLRGDNMACEHGTAQFVADVYGEGLSYQWRGPNRFTATGKTAMVQDVTAEKEGRYELTVTDACFLTKKESIELHVVKDVENVSLNVEDTTVCSGESVLLAVKTQGAALTYKWTFAGAVVGNASTLLIENINSSNSGEYLCEVLGACKPRVLRARVGMFESLTVAPGDSLNRVCRGENVRLIAQGKGVNVKHAWKKDGQNIGAWTPELRLDNLLPIDTGVYECQITSACGDTVLFYKVELKAATQVKGKTPDKFVCELDPTAIHVRAQGENNTYAWWVNNQKLNVTNDSLSIPNVGNADTLYFVCVVTGECGVDTASIKIKVGAFIAAEGQTDTLCEGGNYTYNMSVRSSRCFGDEAFEYYWVFKGDTISRESIMRLSNISKKDEGRYACTVAEKCGDTTVYLDIRVLNLPRIESMTPDNYVVEGSSLRIDVGATGDELKYRWTRNKQPLENHTPSISLNPVVFADGGVYEATVWNKCTDVSDRMELVVWQITTIVSPEEQNITKCVGDSVCFAVEAWGEPGLVYNWYLNEELVLASDLPKVWLSNLRAEQAGRYTCIVSGRGGDDSCYVNLTINALPEAIIAGIDPFCWNERSIEYNGLSNEDQVAWTWRTTGGVIEGRNNLETVRVEWGETEPLAVYLKVTSLQSRCAFETEKRVAQRIRESVYLDAPELVGYCIDSLKLDFGYPPNGIYRIDGLPVDYLKFPDKHSSYPLTYSYRNSQTGCADTVADEVGIDKEPYVIIAKDSLTVNACAPTALPLDDYSEGRVQWSPAIYLDSDTLLHPHFTPGVSLRYQVVLKDKYGCAATDNLWVEVMDLPEITIVSDEVVGECHDITLSAVCNSEYFKSLTWHPAKNLNVNDADRTATVLNKKIGNNSYWATLEDTYGCTATDTAVVYVVETERIESVQSCAVQSFVVDCYGFDEFLWEDNCTDTVRVLSEPGDYYVILTDRFGCTSEASFEIHPTPELHIRDTFVYDGMTMEYNLDLDSRYAPYDIRWQDGSSAMVYTTEKEGYYSVRVTDNIGCSATDTVFLEVRKMFISAPNAFLPESNGVNSKFYLKAINFTGAFEMYIYDRWGELIYKTNEIGENGGWDGEFKGMQCLPGAYVWVAFNNGKIIGKGTVMLVK